MSDIRRAYAHDALGKCAADVEVFLEQYFFACKKMGKSEVTVH